MKRTLLPWASDTPPLMLAPMQGLTNQALRSLFVDWVRPDVLFTEFMRVSPVARKRLSPGDLREVAAEEKGVPLVIQLIGHGTEALCTAAENAQRAGARHLNLNLGCPYGRMTTSPTGGRLLRHPDRLAEILPALRDVIHGSFSIKLRAGYDEPTEIFPLLKLIERSGVDFLILHPRTVVQEYTGEADHRITADVVRQTSLPVIANGDIRDAATGLRILRETGAAGLMLGRGAIADPLLFDRLRGRAPALPTREERADLLRHYLGEILLQYGKRFCGEAQVLSRIKGILSAIEDPFFAKDLKKLKKFRNVHDFHAALEQIG